MAVVCPQVATTSGSETEGPDTADVDDEVTKRGKHDIAAGVDDEGMNRGKHDIDADANDEGTQRGNQEIAAIACPSAPIKEFRAMYYKSGLWQFMHFRQPQYLS